MSDYRKEALPFIQQTVITLNEMHQNRRSQKKKHQKKKVIKPGVAFNKCFPYFTIIFKQSYKYLKGICQFDG